MDILLFSPAGPSSNTVGVPGPPGVPGPAGAPGLSGLGIIKYL